MSILTSFSTYVYTFLLGIYLGIKFGGYEQCSIKLAQLYL